MTIELTSVASAASAAQHMTSHSLPPMPQRPTPPLTPLDPPLPWLRPTFVSDEQAAIIVTSDGRIMDRVASPRPGARLGDIVHTQTIWIQRLYLDGNYGSDGRFWLGLCFRQLSIVSGPCAGIIEPPRGSHITIATRDVNYGPCEDFLPRANQALARLCNRWGSELWGTPILPAGDLRPPPGRPDVVLLDTLSDEEDAWLPEARERSICHIMQQLAKKFDCASRGKQWHIRFGLRDRDDEGFGRRVDCDGSERCIVSSGDVHPAEGHARQNRKSHNSPFLRGSATGGGTT